MDNFEEIKVEFKQLRKERGIVSNDITGDNRIYNFENGKLRPRIDIFIGWLNTMGFKLKIVKK